MKTLLEANQSSSIFQSSLITVGEKMLHGNPIEANQSSSIFQSSLITVGEKMLHGNPNGSNQISSIFQSSPHHSWRNDAPWKPYWKPIRAHPSSNSRSSQLAKRCSMETLLEANQSSSIFQSSSHHNWRKDAPWKPYWKSIRAHPSSNPPLITVGIGSLSRPLD